jgi:hypothetical protein
VPPLTAAPSVILTSGSAASCSLCGCRRISRPAIDSNFACALVRAKVRVWVWVWVWVWVRARVRVRARAGVRLRARSACARRLGARLDEPLDLRLRELARADEAAARCDLVTEGLAHLVRVRDIGGPAGGASGRAGGRGGQARCAGGVSERASAGFYRAAAEATDIPARRRRACCRRSARGRT